MKTISAIALAGLLSVAALGTAQAGVIRSAASGTATSTYPNCCDIARTLDRSGLVTPFNSGVDDFDTYLAGSPVHTIDYPNEWWSAQGTASATITYDLGATYSIGRVAFWNEESYGVFRMDVFGSEDGIGFVQLLDDATPTNHPVTSYGADVFSWSSQNLRYFRFELACEWCSVGEVAFDTSAPSVGTLPEPGMLGLAAVALLGSAAARRRRAL